MRSAPLNTGFKRCHDAPLRFRGSFNPSQHLRSIRSASEFEMCHKVIHIEAFAPESSSKYPEERQTPNFTVVVSYSDLRTL